MVANIRRFKGARPIPPVEPRPITIDGRFDDWKDGRARSSATRSAIPSIAITAGWGKTLHYANQTGRNDIVAAKMSLDAKNVSFFVRTQETLTHARPIRTGCSCSSTPTTIPKTGWLGYDFVVNRHGARRLADDPRTEHRRSLRMGRRRVEVDCRAAGRRNGAGHPARGALGLAEQPAAIDFKWADNIQQTGDWSRLHAQRRCRPQRPLQLPGEVPGRPSLTS